MSKRKITAVAFSVLALGGVGVGTALAGPSHTATKAPAVTTRTVADTDTLQQGDQSTPDVPGAVDAAEPAGTEQADAAETAGTEKAGSEKAGASENGASDGNDGGHADAEGADVNHVGGADEK